MAKNKCNLFSKIVPWTEAEWFPLAGIFFLRKIKRYDSRCWPCQWQTIKLAMQWGKRHGKQINYYRVWCRRKTGQPLPSPCLPWPSSPETWSTSHGYTFRWGLWWSDHGSARWQEGRSSERQKKTKMKESNHPSLSAIQSINQSIEQTINQSIDRSIKQSTSQPIDRMG